VTLALPSPAASGTRTGPWKCVPQQRPIRENSASTVLLGPALLGTTIRTAG
jgi:hypothetical protein